MSVPKARFRAGPELPALGDNALRRLNNERKALEGAIGGRLGPRLDGWVVPQEFGAAADGARDDRDALAEADDAVGGDGAILFTPGTYRVASDLTLSGHVRFVAGAVLEPASGVTVTIDGPLDAPLAQIFDTSAGGTVSFGANEDTAPDAYPQWWGAKGDGSTDSTDAIQAAITQASLGVRRVVIPDGTYILSDTVLLFESRELHMSAHTIVKGASGFAGPYFEIRLSKAVIAGGRLQKGDTAYTGISVKAGDATVRDVRIEDPVDGIQVATKADETLSRVRIENVTVVDFTGDGIELVTDSSDPDTLTDVLIQGCHCVTSVATYADNEHAIHASGRRIRVIGNFCDGGNTTGAAATGLHDGIFCPTDSREVTVQGNVSINMGDDCITSARGDDVSITGNICKNSGLFGIAVIRAIDPEVAETLAISGNVCVDNRQANIFLRAAERATVTGNACYQTAGSPDACIQVSGGPMGDTQPIRLLIADNVCDGGGVATNGITIPAVAQQVVLAHNVCIDAATTGLQIGGASHIMVVGGYYGDSQSGASRTQSFGILLSGPASDVVIDGAWCRNNTADGLSVQASTAVSNLHVTGGVFADNGDQGMNVESDATDVRIVGAVVDNNGAEGIRLNGLTRGEIKSCLARANTTFGILVRDGDDIDVVANRAYDNGSAGISIFSNTAGKPNDVFLIANKGSGNTGSDVAVSSGAGTVVARHNVGYTTEANGTATVANGTTSIAVTHGLSATPALDDISVTPTNDLGSAAKFWISGPTSTQFTINVDADPGAGGATFAWSAAIL